MTFDHLGLIVTDLAAGRAFLEATLRIDQWTPVTDDEALGVRVQFGRSADHPVVELVAPLGPGSPIATALRGGKNVLNHLAYRVARLDEAAQNLTERGCHPAGPAKPARAYGGASVQFWVSPLRFLIELIEAPDHTHPFG